MKQTYCQILLEYIRDKASKKSNSVFFFINIEVLFNLLRDIIYKRNRFFENLLEKNLKFILANKVFFVFFFLSFIPLLLKVDTISKKKNYKKNVLKACSLNGFKMVFVLLAKIITFYI